MNLKDEQIERVIMNTLTKIFIANEETLKERVLEYKKVTGSDISLERMFTYISAMSLNHLAEQAGIPHNQYAFKNSIK